MWNKDEVEGKGEKAKGKMKDVAGEVTGNEQLKEEGAADQARGAAKETYGEGKRKAGEAIEDLGKKLER
ncbi:MAG: CsbD family protein [Vicinamibacterales bacterium]